MSRFPGFLTKIQTGLFIHWEHRAGCPAGRVHIRNSKALDLYVRTGSDRATRERVFTGWYRETLRSYLSELAGDWAVKLAVPTPVLGIKRMRTRWGACSVESRRVWLNLELAKKPPQCIEYVLVHELAHFLERQHSDRFVGLMDQALPNWRQLRDELNAQPLAHEEWVGRNDQVSTESPQAGEPGGVLPRKALQNRSSE